MLSVLQRLGDAYGFQLFSVYVERGRRSFLFRRRCPMLSTSGFVDDVTFSHD